MIAAICLAAGVICALGVRLFVSEGGRGAVLLGAVALLTAAVSPTSESLSTVPTVLLPGAAGLVLGAALGARKTPVISSRSPVTVALTLAVVALLVTTVRSPESAPKLALFLILMVASVLAANRSDARDRSLLAAGVLSIAVAESFLAAGEIVFAGHQLFWDYTAKAESASLAANPFVAGALLRVAGTTGHPIVLGLVAAVGLALLWTTTRARVSGLVRWSLTVVLGLGVVVSGSRSAFVAALIVMCYLVATSQSGRTVRWIMLTFGTSLALVQLGAVVGAQLAALVDSGSYTNRSGSLDAAPDLVLQRPPLEALFGSGFNTVEDLLGRGFLNQNGFGVVDNQLVLTLAEQGVVGLVLLIALVALCWRRADRAGRSVLLVFACTSFTFDFMVWPAALLLMYALVGAPLDPARTMPTPTSKAPLTSSRPQQIGVPQ